MSLQRIQGLDFLFFLNCGLILVRSKSKSLVVKLPKAFFIKKALGNLTFLVTNKVIYKSFLNILFHMKKKLIFFYFFKLRIKGLGYRIKRICSKLYRFFFNFTNFFYFHVPLDCIVKAKGRKIFFFSSDLAKLNTFRANLLLLKKLTPYRTLGLLYPKQIIWMKPGKKKF